MRDTEASERLRAALEALAKRPFPEDSEDDEASGLHAELAEFDGYVVGRLTTLLGGGRLRGDELRTDTELGRRLGELARSSSAGAVDAGKYVEYFDDLDHLLEIGRRLVKKA